MLNVECWMFILMLNVECWVLNVYFNVECWVLNVDFVGCRNQVSVVGISGHTIVGSLIPKSTNHKCSPLFRFLAHQSSGQTMSFPKTRCSPEALHGPVVDEETFVVGSKLVAPPISLVGLDVPPDIFSLEYPPLFLIALIALIQFLFTCGHRSSSMRLCFAELIGQPIHPSLLQPSS